MRYIAITLIVICMAIAQETSYSDMSQSDQTTYLNENVAGGLTANGVDYKDGSLAIKQTPTGPVTLNAAYSGTINMGEGVEAQITDSSGNRYDMAGASGVNVQNGQIVSFELADINAGTVDGAAISGRKVSYQDGIFTSESTMTINSADYSGASIEIQNGLAIAETTGELAQISTVEQKVEFAGKIMHDPITGDVTMYTEGEPTSFIAQAPGLKMDPKFAATSEAGTFTLAGSTCEGNPNLCFRMGQDDGDETLFIAGGNGNRMNLAVAGRYEYENNGLDNEFQIRKMNMANPLDMQSDVPVTIIDNDGQRTIGPASTESRYISGTLQGRSYVIGGEIDTDNPLDAAGLTCNSPCVETYEQKSWIEEKWDAITEWYDGLFPKAREFGGQLEDGMTAIATNRATKTKMLDEADPNYQSSAE